MPTRGKEIHALEKKIRIIAETFCEMGRIKSVSRPDFAAVAGLDYNVLKTAWLSGRVSVDLEQKIAAAAEFDTSDPAWLDDNVDPSTRTTLDNTNYEGRDSAANFRAMLRRRHGLAGPGTAIRVVSNRPHLFDSNLAAFCVDDSGQGSALGEPAPMFLSVIVERGFHPKGIVFGFQRIRFRFVFDQHSLTRITRRLGHATAVKIDGAMLRARGGEHHSEWFLYVEGSTLEGEYTNKDHPLCVLDGMQLGEQFFAEISVRPMDGSLVAVDGRALEDLHKRRVIEFLCTKRLPGPSDSQGWISLGRQRLCILRADLT